MTTCCRGRQARSRERLDVVTIILANRSYATLYGELAAAGVNTPGPQAAALFDLRDPAVDCVRLGAGFGVAGRRVEMVEDFDAVFRQAVETPGPFLIEAVLAPLSGSL